MWPFNKPKKFFTLRLYRNKSDYSYLVYDKLKLVVGEREYEFIPMPEGWLCIATDGANLAPCYIPDPQHRLQFEVLDKGQYQSVPLSLLGTNCLIAHPDSQI